MRNGDFRRWWLSTSISSLGTWLLIVAVPVHVHALTGSAMATGLAVAIEAAPTLLLGPLAGVLVDRWDRRIALAGASLASAGGIGLMLMDGLPFVYVGLAAESTAAVFLMPASRALLPEIVGIGPELASANVISSVTAAIIRMAGPVLGTLAHVQGGLALVVVLDMASYVLAAALVLTIRARSGTRRLLPRTTPAEAPGDARQASPERPAGQPRGAATRLRHELVTGLRYVVLQPLTRGLLLASWIFWTANAGLTALLVPFVVNKLGGAGADVGYLVAALGIGYLIGAALSKPLFWLPVRLSLALACGATGLCFFVLFNASSMAVALAAVLASGIPGSMVSVITQHTVQATTPSSLLGRASAAFNTGDACAAVAGALLAATLSGTVALTTLLNLFSVVVLLSGAPIIAWHQRAPRPTRLS